MLLGWVKCKGLPHKVIAQLGELLKSSYVQELDKIIWSGMGDRPVGESAAEINKAVLLGN